MEPTATTSSSKLILSIVGVLLVGAIVVAVIRSKDETPSDTATTTGAVENKVSGSILDLTKMDGERKCTWTTSQGGVTMTGTISIARGKFRTDVETEIPGAGPIVAHSIGDGDFVYSWTSATSQGFKMKVPEGTATTELPNIEETQALTADYSFNCSSWNADSGEFALPSGITFTEIAL